MKVLMLASEGQKEEWLTLPVSDSMQIEWRHAIPADTGTQSFDACIDLLFDNHSTRIDELKTFLPSLVIVNSVEKRLADIHQHFIRINGWNSFLKRPVIEAATANTALKAKAEELFSGMGRKTEWLPDITGFITPRVVVSIINEAFFALEENVSTQEDIDIAMKAGTNYPYGPFEWSKKIGLQPVYSLLNALSKEQNRYQPSTLLKQAVLA